MLKFSGQSDMQSDNELLVPENEKKLAITNFVSEVKHIENYPEF